MAISPNLPARSDRHRVLLACLLFVAQLFSQLHVLQHLEDVDRDGLNDEICLLCILGASTDHASIDSAAVAVAITKEPQPIPVGGRGFTTQSLTPYQGRAPPSSSSIA